MNLTKAAAIANQLINEHGLSAQGWRFDYDTAVRRFGCTHYQTKRITLSAKLTAVNDEVHVRNTILHEIAHALCGHKAGHGPQWVAMAKTIGCDGSRLYDSTIVTTVARKWRGTCPNCRRNVVRHRRQKISCGLCCRRYNNGKFDPQYLFTWTPA